MNKKSIITMSSIAGIVLLAAILVLSSFLGPNVKVGYAENNYGNTMNSSFYYFNGVNSKKVKFDQGDKVKMIYLIELKKGTLHITVRDQEGNEVFNQSEGSGEKTFIVDKTQTYLIEIVASKANGKFKLTWTP